MSHFLMMGMDVCGGHLDPGRHLMFILTMGLAVCFAFIFACVIIFPVRVNYYEPEL